jgi:hypothetical protein
VLTNTLNKYLSDYVGPDVQLLVSPENNAVTHANQLTYLQLPTPYALFRSRDSGGHIQRAISRILRARAYLDLLVFCRRSPLDYFEGDFVYGSRGFGSLIVSHESNFKVPSECYTIAAHRVLGLNAESVSDVMKCPRCNEAHS